MGNIQLCSDIILKSVFHVPSLTCNLLSVSKLTKDNNCVDRFLPFSYLFQDLLSEMMIGIAKIRHSLYNFEKNVSSVNRKAFLSSANSASVSNI